MKIVNYGWKKVSAKEYMKHYEKLIRKHGNDLSQHISSLFGSNITYQGIQYTNEYIPLMKEYESVMGERVYEIWDVLSVDEKEDDG